jgi:hypothetical protein
MGRGQVRGMSRDDAELLVATGADDADAFGCFYCRHEALVLAYAIPVVPAEMISADLVGDTFIGALRGSRPLQEPARFRP